MKPEIKYKKGYKYWLTRPYSVQTSIVLDRDIVSSGGFLMLDKWGWLHIKAGYAWDGASGPAIDTISFMRGSCVHDALCQLVCEGVLSPTYIKDGNELLYKMCLEDGMNKVRAWCVYKAVSLFCKMVMTKHEILTAP